MKIVIATPILFDPSSPFNHLFKDMIGGFLDDENQVVRLVAVKNSEETEFQYGFTGTNIEYRLYKRKSSDHSNIISRYLRDSFTNIREAIGILRLKDGDVLFEDVSYSSFWAVKAAKIKRFKVIAMLQDVWPDNAVQSHLISEGSLLYRFFEFWQRSVYQNADRIICISDDMKQFISSKGVDAEKIDVIYNWGYSDHVVNISWEENLFVQKYKLDRNKFYAVYAGNIGKMQNVEIVVNAAKELKDNDKIHFLIIGDGARREAIENMSEGLLNVTMLPMQPSELATHVYSAAGVNIIPLVAGGIKTALPSKTGVVLSCGKPVIVCVDKASCYTKMILEEAHGGFAGPNEPKTLASEIVRLSKNKADPSSHICFSNHFVRTNNIKKYLESLHKL